MIKKIQLPLIIIVSLIAGCSQDQVPEPSTECDGDFTYQNNVEMIINETCAYSGCHISGTTGIPAFSTYNELVEVIENGKFEERVLVQMNMPPQNATGGPTELSEDQLNTLRCWLEQGYPQ
jgi:hypothetical protein